MPAAQKEWRGRPVNEDVDLIQGSENGEALKIFCRKKGAARGDKEGRIKGEMRNE